MIPEEPNFAEVIFNLKRKGLTDTEIAAKIKRSQGYVSGIKSGRYQRIGYRTGARLLNLEARVKNEGNK